ncbi:MAG: thioredoxin family protein [Alkalispirochaetaceae bacterium]
MAETPSTMRELGTPAPEFVLPDPSGTLHRKSDYEGKPLLVAFICNHCPFVKHIADRLAELTADYVDKGVGVVLINSNDVTSHPEDAPESMAEFAKERGFPVPYLYDESQEVAKAFHAACTPDFFLFDRRHTLVYRGQFDDSRPGNGKGVTGADLTAAVEALLRGDEPPETQKPSVGCNIKWRRGNEPDFFSL